MIGRPPEADAFAAGAQAAGALAVRLDAAAERVCFQGDCAAFGLPAETAWPAFLDRLASPDRAAARRAESGELDVRLRLSMPDGGVRFVRLIGAACERGGFSGLLLPAGRAPAGALGVIEREAALGDALAAGEFQPFFQPIVDLETGRLCGFEALARWIRPEEGILTPDAFLPVADRLGRLHEIGDQVRAAAVDALGRWRAQGVSVSVNVTASELSREGFVEALMARAREAGVPRGAYKVEVSETEVMADPAACARAMEQLAQGGIGLMLDDFGTGYSSLSRLDQLPFDAIKIDQYFVRHLSADQSARKIVSSVVALARSFGMSVVGEGVETQAAAAVLRDLGCSQGQGFHFAAALPEHDARRVIAEGVAGRFDAPA